MRELMRLVHLPQLTDRRLAEQLAEVDKSIRLLTDEGAIVGPDFAPVPTPDMWRNTTWLAGGNTLYVSDMISDRLLGQLRPIKRHR